MSEGMSKNFKIEVVHDASGEVVKSLEYDAESKRNKAYIGLIRTMNMDAYTANMLDINVPQEKVKV